MQTPLSRLTRNAALVGVFLMVLAGPSEAQFGIPGLGPSIVFDPTNFARNVLHYERRLEQMAMQGRQLEQQLIAMRKLQNPNWRGIQAVLGQMEGLMQQGQALAFTLRPSTRSSSRRFPGRRCSSTIRSNRPPKQCGHSRPYVARSMRRNSPRATCR